MKLSLAAVCLGNDAESDQLTNSLVPVGPGRMCRDFVDVSLKLIFWLSNISFSISVTRQFLYNGPIADKSQLGQIMAWRLIDSEILSEPTMATF